MQQQEPEVFQVAPENVPYWQVKCFGVDRDLRMLRMNKTGLYTIKWKVWLPVSDCKHVMLLGCVLRCWMQPNLGYPNVGDGSGSSGSRKRWRKIVPCLETVFWPTA